MEIIPTVKIINRDGIKAIKNGQKTNKFSKIPAEKKPDWLPGKNYCGNHPHNFYIQLFSDTGLLGLTLGVLMFYHLFQTCYTGRYSNPKCPITSICYIIPLTL